MSPPHLPSMLFPAFSFMSPPHLPSMLFPAFSFMSPPHLPSMLFPAFSFMSPPHLPSGILSLEATRYPLDNEVAENGFSLACSAPENAAIAKDEPNTTDVNVVFFITDPLNIFIKSGNSFSLLNYFLIALNKSKSYPLSVISSVSIV